ncbi:MAG: hypothetical protein LBL13_05945 [Bacteroidales bacterium]|jgi:hypothetical protein|nr:hypothetical protein [Bacteroidales bacterium]
MWNDQEIEKYLEKILKKRLGQYDGNNYFADYIKARHDLVEDVLPNIKITEPSLTDHGPFHVANVLKNAWYLLTYHDASKKLEAIKKFTALDLYVLCLSILFHDVGNINGRANHNRKVLDVYNYVRNNKSKYLDEKRLITKAAEVHCGKTNAGSSDTLLDIGNELYPLSGDPIKLLEIVGILRFADELAEGPQRTSDYLLKTDKITPESELYHKYASITHPFIDRDAGRIVLRYDINVKNETIDSLKEILLYTYKRIIKLDEERKYSKFYSKCLAPFMQTEVTFNFYNYNEENLSEELLFSIGRIILDDKCIPGDKQTEAVDLISKFSALDIDSIISQLNIN